MEFNFVIFPLGDSAVTIDLSDHISEEINRKVLLMQNWFLENHFEGIKDLIVGYSSLSIFYDPVVILKKSYGTTSAFQFMKDQLEKAWNATTYSTIRYTGDTVQIPVCYDQEFGIDLDYVGIQNKLSKYEIVQLHSSKTYRVYMIGFLPGFSYLGQLDEKLIIPRKLNPVPVVAGSVGIAGSQTGIYSLNCPGGWQIIGRTPMKLFDAEEIVPVKLKAGDEVGFYSITRDEFEKLKAKPSNP